MPTGADIPARPQPLTRIATLLARFARMPWSEKLMLGAAWLLLALAATALRVFAFRRLAPMLGTALGPSASIPLLSMPDVDRARLIRRAVARAARLAPLRSDCLPQALVGAVLCRALGLPATVFFGVQLEGGARRMAAHAWLCAGPVAIAGGQSFDSFTVVAAFALPGTKPGRTGSAA